MEILIDIIGRWVSLVLTAVEGIRVLVSVDLKPESLFQTSLGDDWTMATRLGRELRLALNILSDDTLVS